MKNMIPASYREGIQRIEQHTTDTMCAWLEGELRGLSHILAGSRDDYPVQAIVNHHPYLSLEAQKRMADAIGRIVLEWKTTPSDWADGRWSQQWRSEPDGTSQRYWVGRRSFQLGSSGYS